MPRVWDRLQIRAQTSGGLVTSCITVLLKRSMSRTVSRRAPPDKPLPTPAGLRAWAAARASCTADCMVTAWREAWASWYMRTCVQTGDMTNRQRGHHACFLGVHKQNKCFYQLRPCAIIFHSLSSEYSSRITCWGLLVTSGRPMWRAMYRRVKLSTATSIQ